jgi:hypothetical protein
MTRGCRPSNATIPAPVCQHLVHTLIVYPIALLGLPVAARLWLGLSPQHARGFAKPLRLLPLQPDETGFMSLRDQPRLGQRTACCIEAVELEQGGISGFQLLKDLPLDCNRGGCLLIANLQPPFLPFLHTAAKRQEQQPTRSHSCSLPVRSIDKPRPSLRTGPQCGACEECSVAPVVARVEKPQHWKLAQRTPLWRPCCRPSGVRLCSSRN